MGAELADAMDEKIHAEANDMEFIAARIYGRVHQLTIFLLSPVRDSVFCSLCRME